MSTLVFIAEWFLWIRTSQTSEYGSVFAWATTQHIFPSSWSQCSHDSGCCCGGVMYGDDYVAITPHRRDRVTEVHNIPKYSRRAARSMTDSGQSAASFRLLILLNQWWKGARTTCGSLKCITNIFQPQGNGAITRSWWRATFSDPIRSMRWLWCIKVLVLNVGKQRSHWSEWPVSSQ